MSEITKRINELLREKGISKEEFYKKCSITSSAYSQWNTGRTEPKMASLKKIADFLNVNYQWIQFGTGQKEKPAPISESELSPVRKEAIDFVINMDEETLIRFIKAAKAMLGE